MQRTLDQNKKLHALFGQLKIADDIKEMLVFDFSDGRCNSSKDLTMKECAALINHLEMLTGNEPDRKKITVEKMCWRLYFTIRDKGFLPVLSGKEAMLHLDNFCQKIWNLPASAMDSKELGKHIGIVKNWKNKKVCPVQ